MVEIHNLVKKYGNHVAVDGISLKFEKGQIYGFLGPNGAGKSTTMNIITGYLAATSGEVTICGHDIYKEPEKAKSHIGYLPEIPPVYNDMTVKEYLKFACELKKIKKDQIMSEVDRVMKLTSVDDVCDRLINNLSKGYRQRVGFAGAIIGSPDIIILDEPTVGLDPTQIKEIRDLIKTLADSHTVILSSHILSEISEVCTHVFIINKGKIIANDTIDKIQGLLSSNQILDIVAKGDLVECETIIKGLENVKDVSVKTGKEEGTVIIRVEACADSDVREDVSVALAEKRISIFEMKEKTESLEDVFLELTSKEGE